MVGCGRCVRLIDHDSEAAARKSLTFSLDGMHRVLLAASCHTAHTPHTCCAGDPGTIHSIQPFQSLHWTTASSPLFRRGNIRTPFDLEMSARESFPQARLVVVKVGTSVVTRPDGTLALGRVGALVEQIAQLVKQGKRVMLVSSGAIGIGAGKLSEQAVLSRSIRSHLQIGASGSIAKTPSARSQAAAGQGGLMGLYDTLFSQYGLVCGQVLVTEQDFEVESRRTRMTSTLKWMLEMGAVPVLNENDVLSVPERRLLFTDNDSLAVLVALELQADLLMLLSDVSGVYRCAPEPGEDPDVLPVLTRSTKISFGSKSARGRGGVHLLIDWHFSSRLAFRLACLPSVPAKCALFNRVCRSLRRQVGPTLVPFLLRAQPIRPTPHLS